jgi:hypothetical protein
MRDHVAHLLSPSTAAASARARLSSQSIGRGRRTGDGADGSPTAGSARQTTLALSGPLFDGGVRQSQQQAARIELDSARTTLDDQRQPRATRSWAIAEQFDHSRCSSRRPAAAPCRVPAHGPPIDTSNRFA